MSTPSKPLIQIKDVVIGIPHKRRPTLIIVNNANFDINYGEMVGIVGESGSGKTMICRTMIGTLERRGGKILSGDVIFEGQSLAKASESDWKKLRGKSIGYVPQSALAGPNPVLKRNSQKRSETQVIPKTLKFAPKSSWIW